MNIPGPDQISFMLQQCIANAKQASLGRGHIPKDHPHPQVVIQKFMRQRSASLLAQAKKDSCLIHSLQVPLAYPPSVRPIDDLVSMPISQMELQKHHRGKKAILRVITPQDTMTAIMAVVEDEEGTAVLLQLYHQQSPTGADLEDILRPNMILVVKEPFFKAATDGAYSIRVDHVSDVVFLRNTDPRIPSKWKDQSPKTEASTAIREQGNVAVKNQQWAEAEKLYSQAVRTAETSEEKQLAYLNRSLANLRLHRPEKALVDASATTRDGKQSEKGLFREARALYELEKFTESLEKWRLLAELYPQNVDARTELERVEKRIHEAQTGEYDFAIMYEQAKATPPIIDCATYKGPVAVREIPGRGSGLFTTKPVKAGDLLFCEKAFAYCYADKDDPIGRRNMRLLMQIETKRSQVGGQTLLLTDIVQKLYHSPQASEGFKALHHGDYKPVTVSQVDGQQIVDTFFVDRVISFNCFGAARTTYGASSFSGAKLNPVEHTSCGLWLLASRINHSCIGNCERTFIGDMHLVRACQDLAAGTELRFPYRSFSPSATYDEIQKSTREWGFACDCRAVLGKVMGNPVVDPALLAKIPRLLKQVDTTYPKREGAVHPEVADIHFLLGYLLLSLNRPNDGAEAIIKGLEAFGFDIVACPPQSGNKKLEIRRWGLVDSGSVRALLRLHEAYKTIAPELCPKAKHYAKIIYSICTGTDVTIGDVFPELA
ncbi:hypothetical protein CHU98_g11326 [Xylaria longipes]|nr:hypothetical protein CHU98_g11326 [Xylaria longipes]